MNKSCDLRQSRVLAESDTCGCFPEQGLCHYKSRSAFSVSFYFLFTNAITLNRGQATVFFFKKEHESGASALKKYVRYAQLSNEEMELSGLENTWKDIRPLENTSYGKD